MRYKKIQIHFTNGASAEFHYVVEKPDTDREYRFEGQHYPSKYSVVKANVNFIERIR